MMAVRRPRTIARDASSAFINRCRSFAIWQCPASKKRRVRAAMPTSVNDSPVYKFNVRRHEPNAPRSIAFTTTHKPHHPSLYRLHSSCRSHGVKLENPCPQIRHCCRCCCRRGPSTRLKRGQAPSTGPSDCGRGVRGGRIAVDPHSDSTACARAPAQRPTASVHMHGYSVGRGSIDSIIDRIDRSMDGWMDKIDANAANCNRERKNTKTQKHKIQTNKIKS